MIIFFHCVDIIYLWGFNYYRCFFHWCGHHSPDLGDFLGCRKIELPLKVRTHLRCCSQGILGIGGLPGWSGQCTCGTGTLLTQVFPTTLRSVWGDSKCHPKRLAQDIYTRLIPTPYFSLQRLSAESFSPLLKGRPTVCTWRHIAQMTFKGRPEGHRGAKWHAFLILEKTEKCTVPGGRPHGRVIGQMDQDGNPDGLATCNTVFKQAVCVGLNTDIFHIYAIQCKITRASCWCAIHEWVDLIWHILWQLMTCATFLLRKPPRDSSGFWIWPSLRSERKKQQEGQIWIGLKYYIECVRAVFWTNDG